MIQKCRILLYHNKLFLLSSAKLGKKNAISILKRVPVYLAVALSVSNYTPRFYAPSKACLTDYYLTVW